MRRVLILLAIPVALAGCDEMRHQAKKNAYADASVAPGKVPQHVVEFQDKPVKAPPLTLALIERGQERFHIYCTPCHSELGDGNGMIVQRGFPHPPSYLTDEAAAWPPQLIYNVITHGFGAMYSFAYRVQPDDRWAIAAYIKSLQASNRGHLADLPDNERAQLK